jgi:hypothetical protein
LRRNFDGRRRGRTVNTRVTTIRLGYFCGSERNRQRDSAKNIAMSSRIFEFLKLREQIKPKLRLVHIQRLELTVRRQDALKPGHLGAIGKVHRRENPHENYKYPDLRSP